MFSLVKSGFFPILFLFSLASSVCFADLNLSEEPAKVIQVKSDIFHSRVEVLQGHRATISCGPDEVVFPKTGMVVKIEEVVASIGSNYFEKSYSIYFDAEPVAMNCPLFTIYGFEARD